MRMSCFCFGHISRPQRLASEEECDDQNDSFTTSITEFMKPKCLWGEKKNMWKKLGKPSKEHKKQHQMQKEITLDEWFSASSPCRKDDKNRLFSNGGEFYVSEQNWVYPSLGGEDSDDAFAKNSRDSFSMQALLTIEVIESGKSDAYSSCLCRSETSTVGKLKKRVSFKLPEEADIFLFYSPNQGDHED